MASSSTMMKALLGLAAVAAFQNRGKITDFVKNMGGQSGGQADTNADNPAGGLGGLIDSFKKSGLGKQADSWVSTGPNEPVTPAQVEQGVGGDMLDQLAAQTGLSRDELAKRLASVLPGLVDGMTPNGKVPN